MALMYAVNRQAMVTLTPPGIVENVDEWNRTAAHRFNRLVRDIRAAMASGSPSGADAAPLEFCRVAEMQLRGLIHLHVLFVEWGWLPIETFRLLAVRHGFGPRIQLERPRSRLGMAGYFVKEYMAKGGAPLPHGIRAIVYSRGWARVWQAPNPDPVVVTRRVEDLGDHESVESWTEVFDRLSLGPALPRQRAMAGSFGRLGVSAGGWSLRELTP